MRNFCEDCKYFDMTTTLIDEVAKIELPVGACRRFPPRYKGEEESNGPDQFDDFPWVSGAGWCGEFESKSNETIENKPIKVNEYIDSYDLADVLHVNRTTINKWARLGKIPSIILPNRRRTFELDKVIKSIEKGVQP